MTPLPKRRWSTRRQGKKRIIFKAISNTESACPNCGKPKISHRACLSCGFYNGEKILKIKSVKSKKEVENKN